MSKMATLLLEIGTEELPPHELAGLAAALGEALVAGLVAARLVAPETTAEVFATPRRLAVRVPAVRSRQASAIVERRGPALAAAFTATGAPTDAAVGFARSCGVAVGVLTRLATERGEFLAHRYRQPGASLAALVPAILESAQRGLPTGRRMRWGSGLAEFVRPVHWVVLLHGARVIPATLFGIKSGRMSYGHRFHAPGRIKLANSDVYTETLAGPGHVIPSFTERRDRIARQVEALGHTTAGQAVIEPGLLETVTALVEWPCAILGAFDPSFLDLPAEVLIASMRDHQKYFPLTEADGRLQPRFIAVANVDSPDPSLIRRGNERVLAARFADARFFWEEDCSRRLDDYATRLGDTAFEQRLGSLADKTTRLAGLTVLLARQRGADETQAARAAQLAKADLMTGMVGEFPELQGIMGGYYSRAQGECAAVARAIAEHYRPRFAGDTLPTTVIGCLLALADKLDTLVGIYGIGLVPTGDKDPYGLRRTAIGILRLLDRLGEEPTGDLDLGLLLQTTFDQYPTGLLDAERIGPLTAFLAERLRQLLRTELPLDAIEAALAGGLTHVHDLGVRARALAAFAARPEARALAAADKRIRHILRQVEAPVIDNGIRHLTTEAEICLAHALDRCAPRVAQLVTQRAYGAALTELGALRPAVDAFFEGVLVMAEEPQVRRSRLGLLVQLSTLFSAVGDVSCLRIAEDSHDAV